MNDSEDLVDVFVICINLLQPVLLGGCIALNTREHTTFRQYLTAIRVLGDSLHKGVHQEKKWKMGFQQSEGDQKG